MSLLYFTDLSMINLRMSLSYERNRKATATCSLPFIHDEAEFSWKVNGDKVIKVKFHTYSSIDDDEKCVQFQNINLFKSAIRRIFLSLR